MERKQYKACIYRIEQPNFEHVALLVSPSHVQRHGNWQWLKETVNRNKNSHNTHRYSASSDTTQYFPEILVLCCGWNTSPDASFSYLAPAYNVTVQLPCCHSPGSSSSPRLSGGAAGRRFICKCQRVAITVGSASSCGRCERRKSTVSVTAPLTHRIQQPLNLTTDTNHTPRHNFDDSRSLLTRLVYRKLAAPINNIQPTISDWHRCPIASQILEMFLKCS